MTATIQTLRSDTQSIQEPSNLVPHELSAVALCKRKFDNIDDGENWKLFLRMLTQFLEKYGIHPVFIYRKNCAVIPEKETQMTHRNEGILNPYPTTTDPRDLVATHQKEMDEFEALIRSLPPTHATLIRPHSISRNGIN